MKRPLQVGGVAARAGRKVAGFLEVSGTDVRMPLTLVNGIDEGKTLLITAGTHGGGYARLRTTGHVAPPLRTNQAARQNHQMPLRIAEAHHPPEPYILPAPPHT